MGNRTYIESYRTKIPTYKYIVKRATCMQWSIRYENLPSQQEARTPSKRCKSTCFPYITSIARHLRNLKKKKFYFIIIRKHCFETVIAEVVMLNIVLWKLSSLEKEGIFQTWIFYVFPSDIISKVSSKIINTCNIYLKFTINSFDRIFLFPLFLCR